MTAKPGDLLPRACVAIALAGLGAVTLAGLFLGYSYWSDELFSVAIATRPWQDGITLLAEDVHPPLYQAALRVWVLVFGSGESATRAMSACAAALVPVAALGLRHSISGRAFVYSLAFVTVSPLLLFYAQETRSYALLLLFSTMATAGFVAGRLGVTIAGCILAGLTHYYGVLLAGLILAWLFLSPRSPIKTRVWAALAGLIVLAWPIYHLSGGTLTQRLGGAFWIDASPLEAMAHVGHAAIAGVSFAGVDGAGAGTLLLAGLVLYGLVLRRSTEPGAADAGMRAAYLVGLGAVASALVTAHTPISTVRNAIVFVPAGSILMGLLAAALAHRRRVAGDGLALVYVALSVLVAAGEIFGVKAVPAQNIRAASAMAEARATETGGRVFLHDHGRLDPGVLHPMLAHYLGRGAGAELLRPEDHDGLRPGDVVLFMDFGCTGPGRNALYDSIVALGLDARLAMPRQAWACSSGYVEVVDASG